MSTDATPHLRGSDRVLTLALGLLCSAAVVAPAFATSFLPTHDGPQHLLHAWLETHLDEPGRSYAAFVERGAPLTALGYHWLQVPLERLFGWSRAQQLVLSVIALTWSWGTFTLVSRVAPHDRALRWAGFAAAWPWAAYMGFFPFWVATAFATWVLALVAGRARWSARDHVLLASSLLLVAMMHSIAAAWAGVGVVLLRWGYAPPGRWVRGALEAAIAGVPAAAIAVGSAAVVGEALASLATEQVSYWRPIGTAAQDLAETWVGGPAWRSWSPSVLAMAGCVALRRRCPRGGAALALYAAAGWIASVALPLHTSSWEYASPRVLPLSGAAGIAALAAAATPRLGDARARIWTRGAAGIVVAMACASNAWAFGYNRALGREAAPWLDAAVNAPAQSGWLLPIVFEPLPRGAVDDLGVTMRYAKPFAHLGALLALGRGGMTPYLFGTSASVHPMLFRADAPPLAAIPDRSFWEELATGDDPARARAILASLAVDGIGYPWVAVWGAGRWEAFADRGYRPSFSAGRLTIGRFEGCRLTVEVPLGPGEAATLSWGAFPLLAAADSVAAAAGPNELRTTCGDVWFDVVGRTGSGAAWGCAGVPGAGVAVVRLPGLARVRCARAERPPAPR